MAWLSTDTAFARRPSDGRSSYSSAAGVSIRLWKPKAEIAELMGRDRDTIYREIKRNTGGRGYRPKQAQRKAEERRLGCRREPTMNHRKLRSLVTRLLTLEPLDDVEQHRPLLIRKPNHIFLGYDPSSMTIATMENDRQ